MNWGFISQKTAFFIVTPVKTSDLAIDDARGVWFLTYRPSDVIGK
jgi:hypothetical protein